MVRTNRPLFGRHMRVAVVVVTLVAGMSATARVRARSESDLLKFLPNNFAHFNLSGISTTFSTDSFVDLTGEYFQAQGTNGRAWMGCDRPGGTLLASRALTGVSGGLAALARAGIAWTQVAPLFHAAKRKPMSAPFASSSQIAGAGAHEGPAVLLDASDLIFRYRPQGEAVRRGVNLTIESGERVLLEGSSGGG